MADQIKYTQKLKGAKVLVIGGSSGIGFGVAEAAVENGARVTISSSNPDRVSKAVAKIQQAYPSAKDRIGGEVCDLSDEATLEQNVKQLFEKVGGGIDHVVHTAGDGLVVKPITEHDMSSMKAAGMVRFFAPIFVGKFAPGYMNPGPQSSIVLTTGGVADRPMPNWSVVNGYAAGLQGLTRGLALDLKPIRVNLVSPGPVDTELWSGFDDEQRAKMFAHYTEKLPVAHVGRVDELAESYLYLMKDTNTTGIIVTSSGGSNIV